MLMLDLNSVPWSLESILALSKSAVFCGRNQDDAISFLFEVIISAILGSQVQ